MLAILTVVALIAQSAFAAPPSKPVARASARPAKPSRPSKPSRPNLIEGRMTRESKLVILPKLGASTAKGSGPGRFALERNAQGLALSFASSDPAWQLDSTKPLVIQLNAEPPARVVPATVLEENWPAGATKVQLKLEGAKAGAAPAVWGNAAFTICRRGTKECKRGTSSFRLD